MSRFRHIALIAALASATASASAQLRLPASLGSAEPPSLPVALPAVADPLRAADPARASGTAVRALLQRHPDRLERDPQGHPIVRAEIAALAPSEAALSTALAAGFVVAREGDIGPLGLRLVVLRAPDGVSTARALERLRALDPAGDYAYNHLYIESGSIGATRADVPGRPAPRAAVARVGMIDSGVDALHPALRDVHLLRHGCGERPVPAAHGTAVASLLVGASSGFAGALPAATLYAADVYCGRAAGGSVGALIEALGWMALQQVGVVNVSLVGPPNRLLERVVKALSTRGHVIVAAVGNDGPSAPPLYPAGYPDVIAVTGVDRRGVALAEAGRGEHVALAAPGADMAVAYAGSTGYADARGTSFASPLVAGLLAARLPLPDVRLAPEAVAGLALGSVDLGSPGRDPVYGHGLVGSSLRVDVARLQRATVARCCIDRRE